MIAFVLLVFILLLVQLTSYLKVKRAGRYIANGYVLDSQFAFWSKLIRSDHYVSDDVSMVLQNTTTSTNVNVVWHDVILVTYSFFEDEKGSIVEVVFFYLNTGTLVGVTSNAEFFNELEKDIAKRFTFNDTWREKIKGNFLTRKLGLQFYESEYKVIYVKEMAS